MEGLESKKNEVRALVKGCFSQILFSLVPFEIWKDIVCVADVKSFTLLSQTCWGFNMLCQEFDSEINDVNRALSLRKEGQINQAFKSLWKCANDGDAKAMFHLAFAYDSSGWGLKQDRKRAISWFEKSANSGSAHGMAYYAYLLQKGDGVKRDVNLSNYWANKALSTKDSYAAGYCSSFGLGNQERSSRSAIEFFKIAADHGDEFAQYELGVHFHFVWRQGGDNNKAYIWYLKSAQQGLAVSQYLIGCFHLTGEGCEKDKALAISWLKKAANQGEKNAIAKLKLKE